LHNTIKTIIVINESSAGGLVGKMSGGRINNSYVSNSFISGGNQKINIKNTKAFQLTVNIILSILSLSITVNLLLEIIANFVNY
jgi:hypothetical protein